MKVKSIFVSLILAALLCSCSKQLNISLEYNSKNPNDAPVLYWVNNNTGADIQSITYTLNGEYVYTDNLPAGGNSIDFTDFAKKNGERFNIYKVKPLKLVAKANGAAYSVNIDDIPLNLATVPSSENISQNRDVLSWSKEIAAENKTSDGGKVSLSVVLAYNDKNTATEITAQNDIIAVYLKNLIAQKTAADFSPKNEAALQTEIRDYINDNIITGRVREVRFMELDY
jgi:flagellar basal body-associated protein FliL